MTPPRISVVIATLNPRRNVLHWTLDALAAQTLPKSDFEVIVADNGSSPPLEEKELTGARALRLRIVREPRAGVSFARCAGISAATTDWIVFADDDNGLDPDYLEQALRIIETSPHLGAFSGIARLHSCARVAPWKKDLLCYLGIRDYGTEAVTSNQHLWGPWEPIGAGMVFRREIGREFVRAVETNPLAAKLGRTENTFIGGEDSFIAKLAYPLGYSCSYQPSLKFTHWLDAKRFSARHLARTIAGIGQAFVLYETVLGRPQPARTTLSTLVELAMRLRYRMRTRGARAGAVEWFWDLGYFRQVRSLQRSQQYGPEILHRHSEL